MIALLRLAVRDEYTRIVIGLSFYSLEWNLNLTLRDSTLRVVIRKISRELPNSRGAALHSLIHKNALEHHHRHATVNDNGTKIFGLVQPHVD